MAQKILIIEDERLTRTSLVSFLQEEGFLTLEATNGRVGIELANEHCPDLIICDILMPELDGYDVLTILQTDPKTATIPFIFLTVTATQNGRKQSMEMGADDYLTKPITSDKLRAAIATQLNQKSLSLESHSVSKIWTDEVLTLENVYNKPMQANSVKVILLETLCLNLQNYLLQNKTHLDQLGHCLSTSEQYSMFSKLQGDLARLISIVNETSTLQMSLTNENAEALLEIFQQSIDSNTKTI